MGDGPVQPVRPIHPIREVEEVELRRRPSFGQLRQWLAFAKRKGKTRKAKAPSGEGADGEG